MCVCVFLYVAHLRYVEHFGLNLRPMHLHYLKHMSYDLGPSMLLSSNCTLLFAGLALFFFIASIFFSLK